MMLSESSRSRFPDIPHEWLCDGRLLVLNDPDCARNHELFREQWARGQPVLVANVHGRLQKERLWTPAAFSARFGHLKHDIVNTRSGRVVPRVPLKRFWSGFVRLKDRMKDEQGNPMLMKLKDWPPDNDIAAEMPEHFEDLMKSIPLKEYTLRGGRYNLAGYMPPFFARPDLGPKMYIAYGNALHPGTGSTNLHIDMSDACNLMLHVGLPENESAEEHVRVGLKTVDESDCDLLTRDRARKRAEQVGQN